MTCTQKVDVRVAEPRSVALHDLHAEVITPGDVGWERIDVIAPDNHDPSVGEQGDVPGIPVPYRHEDPIVVYPPYPERGIENAGGIEPGNSERRAVGIPDDHDLPVRLDHQPPAVAVDAEVDSR